MADLMVTMRVMLESPEVNPKDVESKVSKVISDFGAKVGRVEVQDIAFGLKALQFIFIMSESLGATDPLEENISNIEGVRSAEVVGITRTLG
ncbi:elongation factor 1-beta [Candidatus Woesearchaeota archaeon]|nr:elongation factor 1-beta [Candidatus Woesearchaeota archaeon]